MTAVLDAISGCMSPIIPAIIGAGIVKVLLIVLGYFVPADNQTMQLLDVIGDAAFDFLPVLVAFSAGRKFGANPMLTASVVAVLIHPDFISLLNSAADGEFVRFLGIPVSNTSYSSTVIPAILTAWVMSYIEKLVDKITPSFTKNFLKPACSSRRLSHSCCVVRLVLLSATDFLRYSYLSSPTQALRLM